MTQGDNIWVSRKLIKSKAFLSLGTVTSVQILLIFFTKRQMTKMGRSGKEQWVTTNNNEIVFTYIEAENKYEISNSAFRNAIDELREKGFIDIFQGGAGTYRAVNTYTLCDRWKLYDTDDYKGPKPRKKGPINRGFQKGNQYGRNSRKKKSTVAVQHSSTVADQHSSQKT